MPAIFKVRQVKDPAHLEYVRRQTCCMCAMSPLSLDPTQSMKRPQLTDAHHLRNTRWPRRFFDWLCIPLCRAHHNFIDTFMGTQYEKREHARLIRVAANMLYRNGRITAERFDEAIRAGENIAPWIDSLISDLQTWDGGAL